MLIESLIEHLKKNDLYPDNDNYMPIAEIYSIFSCSNCANFNNNQCHELQNQLFLNRSINYIEPNKDFLCIFFEKH